MSSVWDTIWIKFINLCSRCIPNICVLYAVPVSGDLICPFFSIQGVSSVRIPVQSVSYSAGLPLLWYTGWIIMVFFDTGCVPNHGFMVFFYVWYTDWIGFACIFSHKRYFIRIVLVFLWTLVYSVYNIHVYLFTLYTKHPVRMPNFHAVYQLCRSCALSSFTLYAKDLFLIVHAVC